MTGSAARAARLAAGLDLARAAACVRVSPAYLGRVERCGAPYSLAVRLASLYRCPVSAFLWGGRTPALARGRRQRPRARENSL